MQQKRLKRLPKKVRICGQDWTVARRVMKDRMGEVDYSTQTITIGHRIALGRQWATLMHEVLHVADELTRGAVATAEELDRAEVFIERVDDVLIGFLMDTFGVGVKS